MVNLVSQKELNVKLYDGMTLPFDKGSFDIVIIYQVFINLSPDIARNLLGEAGRVVKPGGKIFIGAIPCPAKSGLPTHAGNWRTCIKKALRIKQPIHYFSYDYSFFTEEFDRLAFQQVSFFPCSALRTNGDSRFHTLFNC